MKKQRKLSSRIDLNPDEVRLLKAVREIMEYGGGTVRGIVDHGRLIKLQINRRYPKSQMMRIYKDYASFYEQRRDEFINKYMTEYGADKFAVDETIKEIEVRQGVKIRKSNFKQAMTRLLVRRPIKKPSKD